MLERPSFHLEYVTVKNDPMDKSLGDLRAETKDSHYDHSHICL